MGDKFNFHGETQFINKPKDSVSITQNIYKDSSELEQKLDEMFDKMSEKQSAEMNMLIDLLFQKIDESVLKANRFSDEEIEGFNKAKYSSETKAKLKWTYPLSGTIKELTGLEFEFEKEWIRSKEIKSDGIIGWLRKVIPAHELQQTKINEIEADSSSPKALRD